MGKYNWKKSPIWLNILLSLDQLGNTILPMLPYPFSYPGAGNPDKTISYSLGALQAHHGGKIPWRWPAARILCGILDSIEKDHCINAYKNNT